MPSAVVILELSHCRGQTVLPAYRYSVQFAVHHYNMLKYIVYSSISQFIYRHTLQYVYIHFWCNYAANFSISHSQYPLQYGYCIFSVVHKVNSNIQLVSAVLRTIHHSYMQTYISIVQRSIICT